MLHFALTLNWRYLNLK